MLLGLYLPFAPAITVTLLKAPPCQPWDSQGERLANIRRMSHSVHLAVARLLCVGSSLVSTMRFKDEHILCPFLYIIT